MAKQRSQVNIPKTAKAHLVFESTAEVPSLVLVESGTSIEHTFINLTKHEINLLNEYNEILYYFPPSGWVARVNFTENVLARFDRLDVFITEKTEILDLPLARDRTFYIVSHLVKQHAPGRNDLLTPHHLVKSYDSQIVGCRALIA